ncbi:SRPBCC domain-containing protein [Synechococcus sp. PCC 7336]|uniref:SRPBCC domain-containing protein n=1 Tax=Synechococcus sp. PCC 7336 TaxID=195250 RepID=UPI0003794931|nr:SRPBCC domain-containing protein [Synechococcus sp. PCC 7336]
MKEYRTEIAINASAERVWRVLTDFSAYPEWNPLVGWLEGDLRPEGRIQMFIKPLDRSFHATLKRFQENREMTWVGVRFASWFLSGEHYYRLEITSSNSTQLLHGECFRGAGSGFIRKPMLQKMEDAFIQHNQLLKERVENG